jgi:hypothetical protein
MSLYTVCDRNIVIFDESFSDSIRGTHMPQPMTPMSPGGSKKGNSTHHMLDKVLKAITRLSPKAVINMINALYGCDISLSEVIDYLSTWSLDLNNDEYIADIIMAIIMYVFHIELQTSFDEFLPARVVQYGAQNAATRPEITEGGGQLVMPRSLIIYLSQSKEIKDEYLVGIVNGTESDYTSKVPVIKLLTLSLPEIVDRNLIHLVPLYARKCLWKARELKKNPTADKRQEIAETLPALAFYDIIDAIRESVEKGAIDSLDGEMLHRMTMEVYNYHYSKYPELILEEKAMEEKWYGKIIDELKARVEAESKARAQVEAESNAKIAQVEAESNAKIAQVEAESKAKINDLEMKIQKILLKLGIQ